MDELKNLKLVNKYLQKEIQVLREENKKLLELIIVIKQ